MIAQRVRIPCPSCSNNLHVRVGHLGKRGECRYCGHRFLARVEDEPAPVPSRDRAGPSLAGLGGEAAGFGRVVQSLERELQQTWALLTARQASVLEQLIGELAGQSVPFQVQALGQATTRALPPVPQPQPPAPARERVAIGSGLAGPPALGPAEGLTIDPVEPEPLDSPFLTAQSFVASSPAIPQANAVELSGLGIDVDGGWPDEAGPGTPPSDDTGRILRERDEARAECDRLRDEADTLRSELEGLRVEVERLRPWAAKLKRVRADRDRLKADRDLRRLEAEECRARMAELQLTLVEAEAELDDCRARARDAWERRRQGDHDEAERLLEEHEESGRFEFEVGAWSEQITFASKRSNSAGTDSSRA